jgi:hypothetical protein
VSVISVAKRLPELAEALTAAFHSRYEARRAQASSRMVQ